MWRPSRCFLHFREALGTDWTTLRTAEVETVTDTQCKMVWMQTRELGLGFWWNQIWSKKLCEVFQIAAIFNRVRMCLKCLFRAGSLLDAFVLLCSGSNNSISFPQALLPPTVNIHCDQDKDLYVLVKQRGICGAVHGGWKAEGHISTGFSRLCLDRDVISTVP